MKGSFSRSPTVQHRALKPRLRPLSPGASAASVERGHRRLASSDSRGDGGSVVPSPRPPPAPGVLASSGAAKASSTGQPDIPAREEPFLSLPPSPARPSQPSAADGRCVRDPASASRLAEAHARDHAWPRHRWYREAHAVAERRPCNDGAPAPVQQLPAAGRAEASFGCRRGERDADRLIRASFVLGIGNDRCVRRSSRRAD